MQTETRRSNQSLFAPLNSAAPVNGLLVHLTQLGPLARLDFEHFQVAGEAVFCVAEDAAPLNQQAEEARIGTLAYALRKLGNPVDAAEFIRCLNLICAEADARYRQAVASHYYRELATRETGVVLKEMALLALHLAALEHVASEECLTSSETVPSSATLVASTLAAASASLFDEEVAERTRQVRGQRRHRHVCWEDGADVVAALEESGAPVEELDAAFKTQEALAQYDEQGVIAVLSPYERTVGCGRVEPEYEAADLPARAQHLATEMRQAFLAGLPLEAIWEDLEAQLEVLFPVAGRTANGGRFYSHANRELQHGTRDLLEALLAEWQADFHLNALRSQPSYRRFYHLIRRARDTAQISQTLQAAYAARQAHTLSLKCLTALKTAAQLQRERLQQQAPSPAAAALLKEIAQASRGQRQYLRWALYGDHQPAHPVHRLPAQERSLVWQALKTSNPAPTVCAA